MDSFLLKRYLQFLGKAGDRDMTWIDGGRVGFEKTEDRLLMASGGKELEEICSIYSCKNG